MSERNDRRVKLIKVTGEYIAELLLSGKWIRMMGLPDGCRVVATGYNQDLGYMVLRVQHPSFEPVTPDGEIPVMEPMPVIEQSVDFGV